MAVIYTKNFFEKNFKKIASFIFVMILGVTSALSLTEDSKDYIIHDMEKEIKISTGKKDVKSILDSLGITLSQNDEVTETNENGVCNINIKRKFEVLIKNGGDIISTKAEANKTILDVLKESGIALGERDVVTPEPQNLISSNMEIVVNKFNKITVSISEKSTEYVVPSKTVKEALEFCGVAVTDKQDVKPEKNTQVTDGMLISIEDRRTEDTDGKVIDGKRYTKKLHGSVTAYTAKKGAHTSTGRMAQFGVVAVNPKKIAYGTKIYIPGYGVAVAGDTGGALMKGTAIADVYYPTLKQCCKWGRRSLDIYILA